MHRKIVIWLKGQASKQGLILVLILSLLGIMNVLQNLSYQRPSDGAVWKEQESGFLEVVEIERSADSAFQIGDRLRGINDQLITDMFKYEDFLHSVPLESRNLYVVERLGFDQEFFVTLKGIADPAKPDLIPLMFTGFFYLIFLFLLITQDLPVKGKSLLLPFCMMVFLSHAFHYTERFTNLDWISFYLNQIGTMLLPAVMMDLALKKSFPGKQWLAAVRVIHWLPSLAFMVLILIWAPSLVAKSVSTGEQYHAALNLYRGIWGGALIMIAIAILGFVAEVRRSTRNMAFFWAISWIPYVLALWRLDYPHADTVAALAPVILPIAMVFDWTRHREYYLGDIGKRVFVFLCVIFILLIGYYLFIAILGLFMGPNKIGTEIQSLLAGMAIMFSALLYNPLQEYATEFIDRIVYGKRFSSLRSLQELSGIHRADLNIDEFLSIILERIQLAFGFEAGVAYKASDSPMSFQSVSPHKPRAQFTLEEWDFRLLEGEVIRGSQIKILPLDKGQDSPIQADDLICPFRVSGALAALIVLSLHQKSRGLSPEELRLLQNLLNQCDVLMENILLYQSLNEKATSIIKLKEYNENIIESSRIGILTTDNMSIAVSCNSAFAELVGLAKGQIMGKGFSELLAGSDHSHQRRVRAGFLSEGAYKTPNGQERFLEIQETPLKTKDNEVYGTLFLVEDIREKRQVREKLIQQEKLASIGLLAAGVAHEINTPLTGIISYSQLLGRDPQLQDGQKELLNLIRGQSERAANIVSALLNFSRKESTPKGPVDPLGILDQTLRFLSHQIQRARVRVTLMEPAEASLIEGYPNQLQQVFVNLIVNALDAMPDGGDLEIKAIRGRREITLFFKDSGTGMDHNIRTHIFDPFFTTKEVGKGTGLGLSVVYNIVQEHGGVIDVESEPGKGSTFSLRFPLTDRKGEDKWSPPIPKSFNRV